MIRVSIGLQRLSSLSREQFLAYWTQQHAALVKQHARDLGIEQYAQVHGLIESELRASGAPDSVSSAFDGIAEIWFKDLSVAITSSRSPRGREAMKRLRDDERNFLDGSRSVVWWGRLHKVV